MTLSKLNITNAIMWAAMIIAISLMIKDSNVADSTRQMILMVQIAGWFTMSAVIKKLDK